MYSFLAALSISLSLTSVKKYLQLMLSLTSSDLLKDNLMHIKRFKSLSKYWFELSGAKPKMDRSTPWTGAWGEKRWKWSKEIIDWQ